jgi:hypothetical protein
MSMLTEQEYEGYIRLLRDWVDAEKALEGPGEADAEATRQAREAYAAVQSFRERHGLGSEGTRVAEAARVYANRRRGPAEA